MWIDAMRFQKLLCRIGFHSWGKWSDIWFQGVSWAGITGLEPGTTTYDGYYSRNCAHCGKIQHKKDPVKINLTKSGIKAK